MESLDISSKINGVLVKINLNFAWLGKKRVVQTYKREEHIQFIEKNGPSSQVEERKTREEANSMHSFQMCFEHLSQRQTVMQGWSTK